MDDAAVRNYQSQGAKRVGCIFLVATLMFVTAIAQAAVTSGRDAAGQSGGTENGSRKTAPRSAATAAVYQAQNALFQPGLTIKPQFTYTYSGNRIITLNGFLALGAIFLGNINVSQQKNSIYQFDFAADYGISRRWKVGVDIPYLMRHSLFIAAGQNGSTSQSTQQPIDHGDLGDITANMYYQIVEAHDGWPDVIWNLQLLAPTGKSPFGIPLVTSAANSNLQYPRSLPTGQGVWGASSGFTVIQSAEPAILFASVNYYYEFPRSFGNISTSATQSVPGYAQPGMAFNVQFGTAFSLSRQYGVTVSYDEIFTQNTRIRQNGSEWKDVVGSSSNAATFDMGVTYAVSKNFSIIGSVEIGVTPDAPDTQVSFSFPYHF